jgi:hypothetical protein
MCCYNHGLCDSIFAVLCIAAALQTCVVQHCAAAVLLVPHCAADAEFCVACKP